MQEENRVGFTGNAMIQLEDSTIEYVANLKVGDKVWGGLMIQEILKTKIDAEQEMVLFNTGLTIKPYHPIKVGENTEWIFPCDVDYIVRTYVDELYNIQLEEMGQTINLNGFQVATWGMESVLSIP